MNAPKTYTGHIKGPLFLYPGDCVKNVTSVGSSVHAYEGASIALPVCTSVGGSILACEDTSIDLPVCTSVGGSVSTRKGASIALPVCTSVGGYVLAYEYASIDLPVCNSVGGSVSACKGASIALPVCNSVGGYVLACEDASIDLPVCNSVGGYVLACGDASIDLPVCTSVGGYVCAHKDASIALPVCTSVGGYVLADKGATLKLFLPTSGSPRISLDDTFHEKHAAQWGDKITLRNVDYMTMVMARTRAIGEYTVHSARYLSGHVVQDMKPCFVAEQGNVTAHGETIDKAIRDLRFKIAAVNYDVDELVEQVKRNGFIGWNDFRLLTGACEQGLEQGLISLGLPGDTEQLPLAQAMELVKGQYGEGRMKELFGEDRQHDS